MDNSIRFVATLVLALAMMLPFADRADADAIAFDVSTTFTTEIGALASYGFEFVVSSPVIVDKLLVYDLDSDGLTNDVTVSIFPDGTSTVPVGGLQHTFTPLSSDVYADDTPFSGRWLEFDVPDFVLAAGTYHAVATGYNNSVDHVLVAASEILPATDLSYSEPISGIGAVNPDENVSFLEDSYFGPNFTVNPIPEPASAGLLGLAALALIRQRRAA